MSNGDIRNGAFRKGENMSAFLTNVVGFFKSVWTGIVTFITAVISKIKGLIVKPVKVAKVIRHKKK